MPRANDKASGNGKSCDTPSTTQTCQGGLFKSFVAQATETRTAEKTPKAADAELQEGNLFKALVKRASAIESEVAQVSLLSSGTAAIPNPPEPPAAEVHQTLPPVPPESPALEVHEAIESTPVPPEPPSDVIASKPTTWLPPEPPAPEVIEEPLSWKVPPTIPEVVPLPPEPVPVPPEPKADDSEKTVRKSLAQRMRERQSANQVNGVVRTGAPKTSGLPSVEATGGKSAKAAKEHIDTLRGACIAGDDETSQLDIFSQSTEGPALSVAGSNQETEDMCSERSSSKRTSNPNNARRVATNVFENGEVVPHIEPDDLHEDGLHVAGADGSHDTFRTNTSMQSNGFRAVSAIRQSDGGNKVDSLQKDLQSMQTSDNAANILGRPCASQLNHSHSMVQHAKDGSAGVHAVTTSTATPAISLHQNISQHGVKQGTDATSQIEENQATQHPHPVVTGTSSSKQHAKCESKLQKESKRGGLVVGSKIQVEKTISYTVAYVLYEGLRGTVVEFNRKGHALVNWETLGQNWLRREDFRKVTIIDDHMLQCDVTASAETSLALVPSDGPRAASPTVALNPADDATSNDSASIPGQVNHETNVETLQLIPLLNSSYDDFDTTSTMEQTAIVKFSAARERTPSLPVVRLSIPDIDLEKLGEFDVNVDPESLEEDTTRKVDPLDDVDDDEGEQQVHPCVVACFSWLLCECCCSMVIFLIVQALIVKAMTAGDAGLDMDRVGPFVILSGSVSMCLTCLGLCVTGQNALWSPAKLETVLRCSITWFVVSVLIVIICGGILSICLKDDHFLATIVSSILGLAVASSCSYCCYFHGATVMKCLTCYAERKAIQEAAEYRRVVEEAAILGKLDSRGEVIRE